MTKESVKKLLTESNVTHMLNHFFKVIPKLVYEKTKRLTNIPLLFLLDKRVSGQVL
jgi:hypothetical protein